jgi:hypothetical protein
VISPACRQCVNPRGKVFDFTSSMSKVIAGIFTIVGGLMFIYYLFVIANTSYTLDYNDPLLHQSLFQTGHLVPLVLSALLLLIGLAFFFLAHEPNPDIKD